jgi:hypothetical protein
VSMSFPGCCGPGINPDNIIYFHLLQNQGGRFNITNTIGHVLCVILFMNGFTPYVLIVILIFIKSKENLGFHESMFCHCVASARCLIILASCLRFSLCHATILTPFICKPLLQTRKDRKVPKHLFKHAFCSVAILVITAIFSTIKLVESTNTAFLKVFILSPTIYNVIILACVDFFHLQSQQTYYKFCLINGLGTAFPWGSMSLMSVNMSLKVSSLHPLFTFNWKSFTIINSLVY